MDKAQPAVYVVATPIGNLDDLTPRARNTLANVDIIAAEDTRQTKKLLSHLGISGKKLVSYHDHNESERAEALVQQIYAEALTVALVTDAGTPCISDPGFRLVRAARLKGIPVHPVPGVSALTTLVSASGLASNRLLFIGFLPTRAGAIASEIASWRSLGGAAVVFFESTRRLGKTLVAIQAEFPEAQVTVGRELTKLFEEIVTLPIAEALIWVQNHTILKGEATVMVEPNLSTTAKTPALGEDELIKQAKAEFARGATLKDLLRKYQDSGFKRTELYRLLLAAKD